MLKCKDCGVEGYHTDYIGGQEKSIIDSEGVCFSCAFWRVKLPGLKTPASTTAIIAHRVYSIGPRTEYSPYNGMGGRRFNIKFHDGRIVSTCDLLNSGEILEKYWPEVPDNAEFLGGAGYVDLGDGFGCWNSSKEE